ncbi:MAG: VOC family protein [Caldimonas sp.]
MVARLDHITVVAPSVEAGAAYVEAALGVAAGVGRAHPGMATHNLLLSLGPAVYLEIISVDPKVGPIARPRWFGLDHVGPSTASRLAAWVASTDDMAAAALPELGEVLDMRREQHTWKMTVSADGSLPFGGAAPLLIERSSSVNPASALPPSGCLFRRLRVRHPAASEIVALLSRIGLASQPSVVVLEGNECSLSAEIETPSGLRVLGQP